MSGEIVSMARSDYDRQARVNWSTLRHMRKSPAHYRQALLAEQVDTDAMKRGRATHMAVLEPERFRAECVTWDGGVRRGKEYDAFVKANRGREILTMDMAAECKAIAQAARADAVAAKFLAKGQAERTLLWTHANGIEARGRVDFLTDHALVDLKTTRDASPEAFGRQMVQLGSLAQLAYYADGLTAITGAPRPVVLVAVETAPPYAVGIYRLTDDQLEMGREVYLQLLGRLKECQDTNNWPGYSEDVQDLQLPHWAVAAATEDDLSALGLTFGGA